MAKGKKMTMKAWEGSAMDTKKDMAAVRKINTNRGFSGSEKGKGGEPGKKKK